MLNKLKKLSGRFKHFWGFCPKCNSDAPEIYDCPVCNYDTKFPPNKETKKIRWDKFIEQI